MDIVSGIVVFILLWWWVFFMTLPFGVKMPDSVKVGHATSAPEKPMLRRKAMIATIVASILFIIVFWVINSGLLSLDQL